MGEYNLAVNGDYPDNVYLQHVGMTTEQEIRADAVHATALLLSGKLTNREDLHEYTESFEKYIRTGEW